MNVLYCFFFQHPSCLPIDVSRDDWLLGRFGVGCLEFTRSAPATRIDCDLGWREQMNQATSFLDASVIYGSDFETSDAIRTFRNGKISGSFCHSCYVVINKLLYLVWCPIYNT